MEKIALPFSCTSTSMKFLQEKMMYVKFNNADEVGSAVFLLNVVACPE